MKVLIIDKSTLFAGAERSLNVLLSTETISAFSDILFDYKLPHQDFYDLSNSKIKYRFLNPNLLLRYLESRSRHRFARGIRNTIKAIALLFLLTKKKYDIVHFNMYRSSDIMDILVCKLFGIKVIAHIRTLATVINIPLTSRMLVDHFICVSNAVQEGFDLKKKASIVYDAIDISFKYKNLVKNEYRNLANLPCDYIIVSSIGQMEYRKAHDNAISIMPRLLLKYSKLILLIVGDDPSTNQAEFKRLSILVEQLNLSQFVIFMPFTNDIELVYRASDIILSITREGESFGRIPIEAAIYECPCVVTSIGAFKETVIHKKTGMLCEPDDLVGLENSIEELITDETLYNEIIQNAKNWIKSNFSGVTHRNSVKEIYKMVLEH